MATTDPNFNPSGKIEIGALKQQGAHFSDAIDLVCPKGHVKQLAQDHLRIAIMLAVQSFFETD